ncbi:hypothetical protein SNEBB_008124 [Seison nebaliae]|nr:hypothetical protein SNEBB_008124 [Seison nebaliae]
METFNISRNVIAILCVIFGLPTNLLAICLIIRSLCRRKSHSNSRRQTMCVSINQPSSEILKRTGTQIKRKSLITTSTKSQLMTQKTVFNRCNSFNTNRLGSTSDETENYHHRKGTSIKKIRIPKSIQLFLLQMIFLDLVILIYWWTEIVWTIYNKNQLNKNNRNSSLHVRSRRPKNLMSLSSVHCYGIIIVNKTAIFLRNWLLLMFTLQRMLAIVSPLKMRNILYTMRKASCNLITFCSLLLICLTCIIWLTVSTQRYQNERCTITVTSRQHAAIHNIVYGTIVYLLPCILILIINCALYNASRLQSKRIKLFSSTYPQPRRSTLAITDKTLDVPKRSRLSKYSIVYKKSFSHSTHSKDHKTQRTISRNLQLLLAVSFSYIAFYLPYAIIFIIRALANRSSSIYSTVKYLSVIFDQMRYFGHITSFYAYILTGKHYRRQLVECTRIIICCSCYQHFKKKINHLF